MNRKNKNSMLSFDSISEKQEESSDSSFKNSNIKDSILKKNSFKCNDISKEPINTSNISLKGALLSNLKKRKTIRIINNNLEEENKNKRKDIKKNSEIISKRISLQQDHFFSFYNQLKNGDDFIKRGSSSKIAGNDGLNKTILKEKKSLNITINNLKLRSLPSLYGKNSSMQQNYSKVKNKSANLSNSDLLDMKYFNSKKLKNTVLHKGQLSLHEQKNMHSSNLFERLKESYLYEKSEALLFKIKICYGILAVFSFISILLEIADVILFNKKSEEYLNVNYNISIINETNIDNYYFIQNREISHKENSIRIVNLIFSILCFIVHLIIHFIKNNYDKQSKKKKKNYYYHYYRYSHNKHKKRKTMKDQNNINNESHVKLIIFNDGFASKNFINKEEIVKLIFNSVISLIFFPPGINKVFIGIQNKIIYIYSLNGFFLIITFFKLINIYIAFYYLSPFNNLLYKTICSSNMVKMDFKFMFRLLSNFYPITFILVNSIIIFVVICILLYCIEYFSININNGILNNKGYNDLKNFYNEIYLYSFFIIKNAHGYIKADTIIGTFVLLIGGTIGVFISSYFIYYINRIIEFKPEEQQAYTKLVKLLNPLNNEHKAANLLKIFLLVKKMNKDYQNIEEDYKIKKDNNIKNIIQRNFGIRKSNFNFAPNERENSLTNMVDNFELKEKKKFLKYISTKFVLKAKLINECQNYKNNLLVARNNSLSFNDVLKTLGEKMNTNINQLNNKLETLIKNDQKFRNFMKFQENAIKKLKKIMGYEEYLINYLIEKNNNASMDYLRENKEMQKQFKAYGMSGQGFSKKMRSSLNANCLAFNRKPARKKSFDEDDKKETIKRNSKGLFDNPKKVVLKRLKSSVFDDNKSRFNHKSDVTRANTNPIKRVYKGRGKRKSFDDNKLSICSKRNNVKKIETDVIQKIRKKRRSLSGKQKEIMDKYWNKIEKIKKIVLINN